jgi:hypothetical protein
LKATFPPDTRLPFASVTVTVAVVVESPSARMVDGLNWRVRCAGGPAVSVSVCDCEAIPEELATTVVEPAAVPVTPVLQEPVLPVVQDDGEKLTCVPLWLNETAWPDRGWP